MIYIYPIIIYILHLSLTNRYPYTLTPNPIYIHPYIHPYTLHTPIHTPTYIYIYIYIPIHTHPHIQTIERYNSTHICVFRWSVRSSIVFNTALHWFECEYQGYCKSSRILCVYNMYAQLQSTNYLTISTHLYLSIYVGW